MDIYVIGKNVQADDVEVFAIENDSLTQDANFILDRFQGGTDLSLLYGYIVYQNSLGTRIEPMTLSVVGDKVHAKWAVSRIVTSTPGRFDFCLTFSGSGYPDKITDDPKTWSTKINHFTILESLTGDDYAIPAEPILIEMMRISSEVKTLKTNINLQFEEMFTSLLAKAQLASSNIDIVNTNMATTNTKMTELSVIVNSIIGLINDINGEDFLQIDPLLDELNGGVI